MTFKAGMHQPVNDKDVDFEAIFAKMAAVKPRTAFPHIGWGKKCYIEATVKKKKTGNKIAVELFAEITFGKTPTDKSLGYTKDEASLFRGVSVIAYDHDGGMGEHIRAEGEIIDYDEFQGRYIFSDETRVVMDRIMITMEDLMIISDTMLDRVNSAWGNRDLGEKELFSIQYQ